MFLVHLVEDSAWELQTHDFSDQRVELSPRVETRSKDYLHMKRSLTPWARPTTFLELAS